MGNLLSSPVDPVVEPQEDASQATTGNLPPPNTHLDTCLLEPRMLLDCPVPEQADLENAIQTALPINVMTTWDANLDPALVSNSSSCISDYMVNIKPDVEAAKNLFKKLEPEDQALVISDHFSMLTSNNKLQVIVGFLNLLQNYEWASLMMRTSMRELRLDLLGNLPGELVQHVTNYLDPEQLVRCMTVCKKWAIIFSSRAFTDGQLASTFGLKVKAPEHPETPPGPNTYYGMIQRYHRHKMGRPTDKYEFLLPDSEDDPLDFHRCHFDYFRDQLAFLECRGGALRALWLVGVVTMSRFLVYAFPPAPLESVWSLKISLQVVAFLSVFSRCYVFDLSGTEPSLHLLKLPSADYKALIVLGNKVAIIFEDKICCWDTCGKTLRTFDIDTSYGWAMIHPTREQFLTAECKFFVTAFGSYIGAFNTTTYSWTKGKVLNVVRTLVHDPPYAIGWCTTMTEYVHRPCFQDATRHMSVFSAINNLGSMLAEGLGDYLIEHNFAGRGKVKVFIRTLDTQAVKSFTGKLPCDFYVNYFHGGLLSFFHPNERFSQYVWNIHEEDASKAFFIPDYLIFLRNRNVVRSNFLQRSTFTDGNFLVIINEHDESIQVLSYHEGISTPWIDVNYRILMAHMCQDRWAGRQEQKLLGLLCGAQPEGVDLPRQFMLEA